VHEINGLNIEIHVAVEVEIHFPYEIHAGCWNSAGRHRNSNRN